MNFIESTEISYVAVDWGTSSFRLFLLSADGDVIVESESGQGIAAMPGRDFECYLLDELSKLGDGLENLNVILCGMVGSSIGWLDAGYLDCAVSPVDVAGQLIKAPSDKLNAHIVPGLRCRSPLGEPDFMRGEETQILGWLADADDKQLAQSTLCLPGTHTKWVNITDGMVTGFNTSFTGALFSHFRNDKVLVHGDQLPDDTAFTEGVCLGLKQPVLSQTLFSVRGRVLEGSLPASSARSFLSGLLIGSDAGSAMNTWKTAADVTVIGQAEISKRYCQALRQLSVNASYCDGKLAVVRGLRAIDHISSTLS